MADTRANGMYRISKRYVDLNLSSNVIEFVMNSWSKVPRNSTHHILIDGLLYESQYRSL